MEPHFGQSRGGEMSYTEKEIKVPYTIVGHSGTPEPRQSILLTAKGIKFLASKIKDEDMVRIEIWDDIINECKDKKYYQKFTILINQRIIK